MNIGEKLENVYINYCDSVSRAAEVPVYERARDYLHKAVDKTHAVLDTAIGIGVVAYYILDDIINYHENTEQYNKRKR